MTHGRFVVTGKRPYRGHQPKTVFEAKMDRALQRAMNRKDIRLLEMVTPSISGLAYRLPKDWPGQANDQQTRGATEAPLS